MVGKIPGGAPIAPAETVTSPQESFGKVLQATVRPPSAPKAPVPGGVAPTQARPAPQGPGAVTAPRTPPALSHVAAPRLQRPTATQVVGQIAESQRKLDRILKLAESGKTFSPAELLAFQAHAYRASQEIDLASKVVDKATGAIKQTLQTQV